MCWVRGGAVDTKTVTGGQVQVVTGVTGLLPPLPYLLRLGRLANPAPEKLMLIRPWCTCRREG